MLLLLPLQALAQKPAPTPPPPSPVHTGWVDVGVRADGMERFDHVALLEAGLLCGTRAGTQPVCATEPQFMDYAKPYEALTDVVKLQALNYAHCVLYGSGALHCERDGGAPTTWPRVAAGVVDFVIGVGEDQAPLVFALLKDARVVALRPPRPGQRPEEPATVATQARSLVSMGTGGGCVLVGEGSVWCSPPGAPLGPMVPTDIHDAKGMYYGRVVLHRDGTYTGWPTGPFPPPARFVDYAPQAGCFLTTGGDVECGGMGANHITFPTRVVRFAPQGDALCVVLSDHTSSCFGPFLEDILRLAAR